MSISGQKKRKQHCSGAVFHRPAFISHPCCLQERQMWTRTMGPPRRAQRWQTPKAQQTRRMPGPRPTQLTRPVAPTWSASFPEMPQGEKTTPSKIGPRSQTSYRPSKRTVQQLQRIRIWWLLKNAPLSGTDQKWHLRALQTMPDMDLHGTETRVYLTRWADSLEVKDMFPGGARARWALRNRELHSYSKNNIQLKRKGGTKGRCNCYNARVDLASKTVLAGLWFNAWL